MNRYQEMEELAATTRAELPGVAITWLAAVRAPLEKLTMAAVNAEVSDAEFVKLVEEFSASLPDLLDEMDNEALAKLMEESMGAAMANGLAARLEIEDRGS